MVNIYAKFHHHHHHPRSWWRHKCWNKTWRPQYQGRIMVPPGTEAWKWLRAPRTYICNIDLILVLSRGVNCDRTAGRIEMPLGKNFRRPQIFSLEISGPKVVLLCKFLLYRAVRAPVRARALRLQPHQPHGWSSPVGSSSVVNEIRLTYSNIIMLCTDMYDNRQHTEQTK